MRPSRITPINLLVHIGAVLPLMVLYWDYTHDNLTINWIQGAEQRTGKIALILLMLSLSCTPLGTLTGWRKTNHLRRPLGLYAFFYALLHFTIFTGIDYGFDLSLLKEAIFEKPYALVGFSALLLLIPLAATSWKWWMKRLGKAWTRLHRLVYLAGVLVILHYAWVVKGDLFALRGAIIQPLLYSLLVFLLLILRVPPVRRWVVRTRRQLQVAWQNRKAKPETESPEYPGS